MCKQRSFVAHAGGNLTITVMQLHSKPCLHLRSQKWCMFSADSKISYALDCNTLRKQTINWLSPTFILKKNPYCCFLRFKYLTGLLPVTPLFNALTLHRARFELLQKRVCPFLDFQDLVCIFIAVKYWKQKCESTSWEKSWLKTGSGPSQRTLIRTLVPLSSTAREPALETMGCQCCAAEASSSLCSVILRQLTGLMRAVTRQPSQPSTVSVNLC